MLKRIPAKHPPLTPNARMSPSVPVTLSSKIKQSEQPYGGLSPNRVKGKTLFSNQQLEKRKNMAHKL